MDIKNLLEATHISIDIETLDDMPGAAIFQIGAVVCHMNSGVVEEKSFKRLINIDTCQDAGLTIGQDTLVWWMQRADTFIHVFNPSEAVSVDEALDDFDEWLRNEFEIADGKVKLWVNGAGFNFGILKAAMKEVYIEQFWHRHAEMDLRTLYQIFPDYKRTPSDIPHDALSDAIAQGYDVLNILNKLKSLKDE